MYRTRSTKLWWVKNEWDDCFGCEDRSKATILLVPVQRSWTGKACNIDTITVSILQIEKWTKARTNTAFLILCCNSRQVFLQICFSKKSCRTLKFWREKKNMQQYYIIFLKEPTLLPWSMRFLEKQVWPKWGQCNSFRFRHSFFFYNLKKKIK